ncbi:hypothetical protein Tco_0853133 [Tanacetum coccineum]
MKRISKGYSGVVTPLFNTMLVQHQDEEPFHETTHESSPLRITSLPPSLSPQTHLSTSQPQTTFVAEEPALMPHESPLQSVHSLGRDEAKKVYSSALTKLILRVKKLGKQVKTSKAIRRVRIVLSKDEDAAEDSSKQGRKISKIDTHPSISLVQDGWTFMVLGDARREEPIRLWERCVEKRKDKRKAIMREDESIQKKTKKQLEQERLSHETAIRLQEQIDEEERKRIARDAEIAKQLQEEYNRARQEQEVVAKDDQAHVIDWSDPAVIRYHAQQNRPYSIAEARKNMCIYLKNQGGFKMSHFKGMSYDDIRPIFERVWDQNQSFVPMDSEKEKGSEKKGSRKKSLARKRATEKQSEESTKRQKIEDDIEKEELKAYLDLVPREEFAMEIESLAISIIIDANGSNQDSEEGSTSRQGRDQWPDRLFDSCGIHILLMDNGIAIHMMIEKKYPLTQEMLSKMLSRKLEVDHENEMAFELLSLGEVLGIKSSQDSSAIPEVNTALNYNEQVIKEVSTASIILVLLELFCTARED